MYCSVKDIPTWWSEETFYLVVKAYYINNIFPGSLCEITFGLTTILTNILNLFIHIGQQYPFAHEKCIILLILTQRCNVCIFLFKTLKYKLTALFFYVWICFKWISDNICSKWTDDSLLAKCKKRKIHQWIFFFSFFSKLCTVYLSGCA